MKLVQGRLSAPPLPVPVNLGSKRKAADESRKESVTDATHINSFEGKTYQV
jgi:hypothetical protein